MLAADTRVRVPSAPLTDTPVAAGPLTFLGHRGAYQATRKAAGSYRVVFVGDSMIYGQGIPASQTLAFSRRVPLRPSMSMSIARARSTRA